MITFSWIALFQINSTPYLRPPPALWSPSPSCGTIGRRGDPNFRHFSILLRRSSGYDQATFSSARRAPTRELAHIEVIEVSVLTRVVDGGRRGDRTTGSESPWSFRSPIVVFRRHGPLIRPVEIGF